MNRAESSGLALNQMVEQQKDENLFRRQRLENWSSGRILMVKWTHHTQANDVSVSDEGMKCLQHVK
uniref:Uncharacterized protein n=1 Tax=Peronospora matthiolae TaxID=2874970 RepID=A0AAV1VET4_9STRA